MNRSVHPTVKRLVATQARRTPGATATATRAIPRLAASKNSNNNNNNNERTKTLSQARLPLQSPNTMVIPNTTDQYDTSSSFETALDQVLRIERDSQAKNANSHNGSMESCVRDFFKV
jgi:hypothetical protein